LVAANSLYFWCAARAAVIFAAQFGCRVLELLKSLRELRRARERHQAGRRHQWLRRR